LSLKHILLLFIRCLLRYPACRENAEAIAFYSSDEREAADLCQRLAAMLVVLLRRIRWLGWAGLEGTSSG
jgi:hypothetical protein